MSRKPKTKPNTPSTNSKDYKKLSVNFNVERSLQKTVAKIESYLLKIMKWNSLTCNLSEHAPEHLKKDLLHGLS